MLAGKKEREVGLAWRRGLIATHVLSGLLRSYQRHCMLGLGPAQQFCKPCWFCRRNPNCRPAEKQGSASHHRSFCSACTVQSNPGLARACQSTDSDARCLAGGQPAGELSEADKEVLGQWVNPAYLDPKAWASIQVGGWVATAPSWGVCMA
jgi:hypothetical protein